jgi:aminoacyl tRNA synthase complex-interacting multifunctional protein 1
MVSALDIIDEAIAELEARLNLKPGEETSSSTTNKKKPNIKASKASKTETPLEDAEDQPDICKLEFKVGVITKVWTHENADKLYCEEIDVGEEEPRQIASGLRPHFSLEQMQGQRLLVMSNLKAKNLVGFKSNGMVLCAAQTKDDGTEKVEFVEPPEGAAIGEVITFEGLPAPRPVSAAQVEKRKVLQACADGLKTTEECLAAWNGHVFMTSAGPCKAKTIAGGVMR